MDNTIKPSVSALNRLQTTKIKKQDKPVGEDAGTPKDVVRVGKDNQDAHVRGFGRVRRFMRNVSPDISIAATGGTALSFGLNGLSVLGRSTIGHMASNFSRTAAKILGMVSGPSAAVVPYAAGIAAGLNLLKGAKELFMGNGVHDKINGALDIGLAVACTASALPATAPLGLLATGVLGAARIVSGMIKTGAEKEAAKASK